jgi:hypothetical protein
VRDLHIRALPRGRNRKQSVFGDEPPQEVGNKFWYQIPCTGTLRWYLAPVPCSACHRSIRTLKQRHRPAWRAALSSCCCRESRLAERLQVCWMTTVSAAATQNAYGLSIVRTQVPCQKNTVKLHPFTAFNAVCDPGSGTALRSAQCDTLNSSARGHAVSKVVTCNCSKASTVGRRPAWGLEFAAPLDVFARLMELTGSSGYLPRLPPSLEVLQWTALEADTSTSAEYALLQVMIVQTRACAFDVPLVAAEGFVCQQPADSHRAA